MMISSNWFKPSKKTLALYENSIKEIIENRSDDFHNQFTPFSLCVEMVEKVGSYLDSERQWLVIANLEFVIVLKKYFEFRGWNFDNVSFATPCDVKATFAKMLGVKNIVKYSYSNFKESWNMGMKFDVIIGNPPYKGEIHMNMLEKAYDLLNKAGHLIFVQPSCYVFTFRPSKFNFFDDLKQHIFSIKIFNGNVVFDNAKFFSPIMITHIINDHFFDQIKVKFPTNIQNFTHDKQLNVFGNDEAIQTLFDKLTKVNNYVIGKTCWTRHEPLENVPKTGYVLWFSGIRGHISSNSTEDLFMDDFFTIVQRNQNAHIIKVEDFVKNKKGSGYAFHFNTKEEAQNMYKYLTSNFVRRALSFIKNDQNINLRLIPWLDFTQEWDDEKLFKHFNLSQEEINFINEIPQYY